MYWMPYAATLIAVISLTFILLLIPLSTLIHELGHALPALWFTKERVTVFVGSYGDESQGLRLSLGRLRVFLLMRPFRLRGGLCRFEPKGLTHWRQVLIIACGPMANLLVAGLVLGILLWNQVEGLPAVVGYLFCIYEVIMALYNLVPSDLLISLHNGQLTMNDASLIKSLFEQRSLPPAYFELQHAIETMNDATGAEQAEALLAQGFRKKAVYQAAVLAHIRLKNYERAVALQQEQVNRCGGLDVNDQINKALLMMMTGQREKSIRYSQHLLQQRGRHLYLLNNLGYALAREGRYQEAIPYLDEAITINADFAYAYCNRAFAWLKLGELEKGRRDNEQALLLDPTNAHGIHNAGLYCLYTQDYEGALEHFLKAKELEVIEGQDELIAQAEGGLNG